MTPCSDAYFASPLALRTPGKQCGLTATGVYQPSLRSPWLEAPDFFTEHSANCSSDRTPLHPSIIFILIRKIADQQPS
ncbi:MAG: hypothetical protein GY814_03060 [Gammaproteobacteria bacterium]|nr:hypothetical protein [Gammaproteobacteria bacterium]